VLSGLLKLAGDSAFRRESVAGIRAVCPFCAAHGAFTCGNPFKTCTYYFGRATTRQIYVASGQADGLRALCLRLEEIRTRVVCEVLLTLATLVVREEAGRAVAAHGCLAAALGNVRLRTDTGPHCRP
jgi:hypothetical protein